MDNLKTYLLTNYKDGQVITLIRNNYSYKMIKQKGISKSEFVRRVLQAIRLNRFTSMTIDNGVRYHWESNVPPTSSNYLNDGHSVQSI